MDFIFYEPGSYREHFYGVRKAELEAFAPQNRDRVMYRARQDVANFYLSFDGYCALDLERCLRRDAPFNLKAETDPQLSYLVSELSFVDFAHGFFDPVP